VGGEFGVLVQIQIEGVRVGIDGGNLGRTLGEGGGCDEKQGDDQSESYARRSYESHG
jgi:hypothetical protein